MRKNAKHKTILVESCMGHIQWKHEYANWLGEVNIFGYFVEHMKQRGIFLVCYEIVKH
jgi:hypothetical protein